LFPLVPLFLQVFLYTPAALVTRKAVNWENGEVCYQQRKNEN
jgi:hypothetical protein